MHASILPAFLLLASVSATAIPASEKAAKPPCSEAVTALATGIHLNIQGQHAEFNGTQKIIDLETKSPGDLEDILIAKGELLSDIQAGMNIREFNQEIAPAGNPAIPGLAKYEMAQQTEQMLAMGLKGIYQFDEKSLKSLKSDIMAGIKLNMMNLQEAISQCTFTLQFPPANQMG